MIKDLHRFIKHFGPPRWRRGSGLDFGSEDPGSIPRLPSPRVGPLMASGKAVKDVFRRPGARVEVGSARYYTSDIVII